MKQYLTIPPFIPSHEIKYIYINKTNMFVRKLFAFLMAFLWTGGFALLYGQRAYVNTPTGIYELNGGIGSCSNIFLTNECNEPGFILSLALYKDTIYYNTSTGSLKRFKIGVPGSCQTLANVGALNSMTIDKNGIVYLTGSYVARYNPYTNQLTNLGNLPFGSAGDLFYFNDKLLLAGVPAGIYEININDPMASTLFMGTNGLRFFGLISFPESCSNIKYYGLNTAAGATELVELDMVNKVVIGTVCNIPLSVYDAASITETGVNQGIIVTSLNKTQPCPGASPGAITITAISPFPGQLSYTLDNTVTNITGSFSGIAAGDHTIRITSTNGCQKDTVFTLVAGLDPAIGITKINPDDCNNSNGSVVLAANSVYTPLTYTWVDGNQSQNSGNFTGLSSGIHHFIVKDASGCTKDTAVELVHDPQAFVSGIDTRESHCELNNGWIKIAVSGNASNVSSSINQGSFTPSLQYMDLVQGSYYLQVKSGTHCYFDTTIVIQNINDPKPQVQLQTRNQFCFINNGSIGLTVTGNEAPYTYQLNSGGFGTQNQFVNLEPGQYTLDIKNKFGCQWDTFAVIAAYPRFPVFKNIQYTHPTCRGITDGEMTVNITGTQGPYSILINGQKYNSGQKITGLTEGEYAIEIINNEQCRVDTAEQSLVIPYEAHCNDVFIPNAFTPNNDGKNDVFRPAYSSFIKNIVLAVYERHGQKIYEGRGTNIYWDGTYKGVRQPPAVYVYTVSYTDYFGVSKLLKGTFVLIR